MIKYLVLLKNYFVLLSVSNDDLLYMLYHRYGAECLFRMFSYGLERSFRPSLFYEFQELVLRDWHEGRLYALEKYWALFAYSTPLTRPPDSYMHPVLRELLRTRFRTIADFRRQVVSCK